MTSALKPDLEQEHPIIAWAGILAVLAAILLILWARIEVHGTRDLESTLAADEPKPAAQRKKPSPAGDGHAPDTELEEAVAAGRWAAGFSP